MLSTLQWPLDIWSALKPTKLWWPWCVALILLKPKSLCSCVGLPNAFQSVPNPEAISLLKDDWLERILSIFAAALISVLPGFGWSSRKDRK